MPFEFDDVVGNDHVAVTFSGRLQAVDFRNAFQTMSDRSGPNLPALVDLSACTMDVTAHGFMTIIDDWHTSVGANRRAAFVFDPERHKDQVMLFDTKSFLAGGYAKSFMSREDAAIWLNSWLNPPTTD